MACVCVCSFGHDTAAARFRPHYFTLESFPSLFPTSPPPPSASPDSPPHSASPAAVFSRRAARSLLASLTWKHAALRSPSSIPAGLQQRAERGEFRSSEIWPQHHFTLSLEIPLTLEVHTPTERSVIRQSLRFLCEMKGESRESGSFSEALTLGNTAPRLAPTAADSLMGSAKLELISQRYFVRAAASFAQHSRVFSGNYTRTSIKFTNDVLTCAKNLIRKSQSRTNCLTGSFVGAEVIISSQPSHHPSEFRLWCSGYLAASFKLAYGEISVS